MRCIIDTYGALPKSFGVYDVNIFFLFVKCKWNPTSDKSRPGIWVVTPLRFYLCSLISDDQMWTLTALVTLVVLFSPTILTFILYDRLYPKSCWQRDIKAAPYQTLQNYNWYHTQYCVMCVCAFISVFNQHSNYFTATADSYVLKVKPFWNRILTIAAAASTSRSMLEIQLWYYCFYMSKSMCVTSVCVMC